MVAPKTETIARLVHALRGERVLFDADLAFLYAVSTKALNQAVKRNRSRDAGNRSQIVTGSAKHRDPAYLPYVFTEQGVAMLSSVLRSPRQSR